MWIFLDFISEYKRLFSQKICQIKAGQNKHDKKKTPGFEEA